MVRGCAGDGSGEGVTATTRHEGTAPVITEAAGTAAARHRRCIATGETHERGTLVRLVVSPEGEIVPDVDARLPGRGLWLSARRDIVERAVAKRLFTRAARRPVAAPKELADRIEALLVRRCCEAVGLARRAGLAVAGFERVSEAVRGKSGGLLLFALDSAEGGRRKLSALGRDLPSAVALTAAELGAAFGRERIAHVWVGPGPLCRRLVVDVQRIAGFRAGAVVDRGVNFAPVRSVQEDGGSRTHD